MGQEEELLRIAKKLEKMVARKNTVRLQSLGRSPRLGRRGAGEPGSPGACAGSAPGVREWGTGTPGRRDGVGRRAPRDTCWALRGGREHGPGRRGIVQAQEAEAQLVHVPLDASGSPWTVCAGSPGKAGVEPGKDFGSPCAHGVCKALEWRGRLGLEEPTLGGPRRIKETG